MQFERDGFDDVLRHMINEDDVSEMVYEIVEETSILDMHTHLYPQQFGELLLRGVDELLTYHYLVAEVFRAAPMDYDAFFAMSKRDQADYIWRHLFIERSPISEACRGVLTCLDSFGLDVSTRDLAKYRKYFASMTVEEHIDTVFEQANLSEVVMTNDPFDPAERAVWETVGELDERFLPALRLDKLLVNWPQAREDLSKWGYAVGPDMDAPTAGEVRRFLSDQVAKMKPMYMAVSLTPDFACETQTTCGKLIDQCVLPVCREHGLPFAMMIGVKRQVNPSLRLAGDGVGRASVDAVEQYCAKYPDNKFLVTMLSRENQHELCVAARKFHNLMIFGCWWFLNDPSIIAEITMQRIELLGLSIIPQHSDARVLDQVVYKWDHSREVIGNVLAVKYESIAMTGWTVTEDEIRRDVERLFGGNFVEFVER